MRLQQTGAVSPFGPTQRSGLRCQRLHSALQREQARHAAGQGPQTGHVAAGPRRRLRRLYVPQPRIVLFISNVEQRDRKVK